MKKIGMTVVLLALFILSVIGQIHSGLKAYNDDRKHEGLAPLQSYSEYIKSGHFISSVAENMESEFLQMGLFVILSAYLYQRGSSESKKLPEDMTNEDREKEMLEEEYCRKQRKLRPVGFRFYEYSLTLALTGLFLFFFLVHAEGSYRLINEEHASEGKAEISFMEVFKEDEFWFESFQNWQSEFFSVASLGLLSIFLRQKGSPQSKKMRDSNWKTGSD
ncbi:MAG: hypothetical protein K0R29_2656 [Pseudobdellovibrio sp.]|jgi:hypothetical protein|nr:hypothetical protein [Pseudobdellovibrio sp.]